jgi:hypothetical protein
MSISEAMQSLGDPYSVSDAGSLKIVYWRTGNIYWSGVFNDGIASEVNFIRF